MKMCGMIRKKLTIGLLILVILPGIATVTSTEGFASETEEESYDSANISDTEEEFYNDVNAVSVEYEDGMYVTGVALEGGSGRASVTSPCTLIVEDAKVYARIEWSSPYYDYMIVEDVIYLPVNEDGNSVFEIPVTVFDEPMTVIADTTAMSVPHEIEYTLTFDSESITNKNAIPRAAVWVVCVVLVIIVICIAASLIKKKRNMR